MSWIPSHTILEANSATHLKGSSFYFIGSL